ncbi:MAG: hypothetical protein AABW88_03755 [Nanoarchaeota archaeon]
MNKKAMMEPKDWFSGLVGIIVFAVGLIPLLEQFNVVNWGISEFLSAGPFMSAVPFILAVLGFYLAIESIIELTNSNHIGWLSFFVGVVIMAIGILSALQSFGIGPGLFGLDLPVLVYNIIFIIEGLFLMIAMFAMEL